MSNPIVEDFLRSENPDINLIRNAYTIRDETSCLKTCSTDLEIKLWHTNRINNYIEQLFPSPINVFKRTIKEQLFKTIEEQLSEIPFNDFTVNDLLNPSLFSGILKIEIQSQDWYKTLLENTIKPLLNRKAELDSTHCYTTTKEFYDKLTFEELITIGW